MNYNNWNYWAGLWTCEIGKGVECTMIRTPSIIGFDQLTKAFMNNMKNIKFIPTQLIIGQIKNKKTAMAIYDKDDFSDAIAMFLEEKTPKLSDVMIFKLEKAIPNNFNNPNIIQEEINKLLRKN